MYKSIMHNNIIMTNVCTDHSDTAELGELPLP